MAAQINAHQRKQRHRQQHAFNHARVKPRDGIGVGIKAALFGADMLGNHVFQHTQHLVVFFGRADGQAQAVLQQGMRAVQVFHQNFVVFERVKRQRRVGQAGGYKIGFAGEHGYVFQLRQRVSNAGAFVFQRFYVLREHVGMAQGEGGGD